jgi:hypothetical protein
MSRTPNAERSTMIVQTEVLANRQRIWGNDMVSMAIFALLAMDVRESCETKPILRMVRVDAKMLLDKGLRDGMGLVRVCKTKPIWPEKQGRDAFASECLMVSPGRSPAAPLRTKSAKQSQTWRGWEGWEIADCRSGRFAGRKGIRRNALRRHYERGNRAKRSQSPMSLGERKPFTNKGLH